MLTADFSRGLPDLRSGVYRHYKGKLYLVLGYAHDANAEDLVARDPYTKCFDMSKERGAGHYPLGERNVVVYVGLELTDSNKGPRLAVRTAEDFFALVCYCGNLWECQEPGEGHENPVPRFEYTGPAWYGGTP